MKIILIIILVYFGLMLLGRYVLPYLLHGYVKHYSKKFYDEMEANKRSSVKKEGEVEIKHKQDKNRKQKADEGEYVDYEEVN